MLVSWKNGRLIAARNTGHLKNRGEKAMSKEDVAKMFAGRGTLTTAFVEAVNDLEKAFSKLTDAQRNKIFGEGKRFVSVEVLHSANPNILHYGFDELRFHGSIEYDESGKPISQLNKEHGRILAGMIEQVRAHEQSTYKIKAIDRIELKKLPNYAAIRSKMISELTNLRKKFKLSKSATILEYKKAYWSDFINGKFPSLSDEHKAMLLNRWAVGIKKPTITALAKEIAAASSKEIADSIKATDKTIKDEAKKMQLPFEIIFLKVGVEVLRGMSTFMAVNPEFTLTKMRKDFDAALEKIQKSNDPAIAKKLALELSRIDQIGGIDKLVPTEGVTFFYKGELLKLTGLFAPINQIINLLWRI